MWCELPDHEQGYNHTKFERLHKKPVSTKEPMLKFLSSQKHVIYLTWICAKEKNSGMFIIYLTYLTILQSFNFTG